MSVFPTAISRLRRWLPEPPSAAFACRRLKVSPYELLGPGSTIVDIGAKSTRGRYSFGSVPEDARYLAVDLVEAPGVDIVADAHDLGAIASESVDCVLCISVLMYLDDPKRAIDEMFRVLRPGGVVYISTPFLLPYSPDPIDANRHTFQGLARLCAGFETIESGFNRGPASTFAQILPHFLATLCSFGVGALHTVGLYGFRWLTFWIKYLDVVLVRYPGAHILHTGSFFLGRRPSVSG